MVAVFCNYHRIVSLSYVSGSTDLWCVCVFARILQPKQQFTSFVRHSIRSCQSYSGSSLFTIASRMSKFHDLVGRHLFLLPSIIISRLCFFVAVFDYPMEEGIPHKLFSDYRVQVVLMYLHDISDFLICSVLCT